MGKSSSLASGLARTLAGLALSVTVICAADDAPEAAGTTEVEKLLVSQSPFTGHWQAYSYRGGAGGHTSFGVVTVTFAGGEGLSGTVRIENLHTGLAETDAGAARYTETGTVEIDGDRRWRLELMPSGALRVRVAPAFTAGEIVDVELHPAPGRA